MAKDGDTATIKEFTDRVAALEKRYHGAAYKHVYAWQMPKDLMVRLRDVLEREWGK